MKRAILLGIVLFSFSSKANCQLVKNTWLVGGSGFYSSTETMNDPGTIKDEEFKLSPNAGFFVTNNFAVGIRAAYSTRKFVNGYTYPTTGYSTYTDTRKGWELGPFVRYYFLQPEKLVNLFVDAAYSHGVEKYNDATMGPQKSNNYSIGAGPVIFFNPNVGLELMLGYAKTTYRNSDIVIVYNNFFINIGFQIHLKK